MWRELGQLAQTDHAYIYRLEQGEKGAPSEDVLLRLIVCPDRRPSLTWGMTHVC